MELGRCVCDGDLSWVLVGDVGLVGDDVVWICRIGRLVKMR